MEESGNGGIMIPEMKMIARVRSDFGEKFGIPRQSGMVPSLRSEIIFEPGYRDVNALKGLEGFSHIWILWLFSAAVRDSWSPTVRPPRLGGDVRMGVFATRSPFRPNPIGLSCVRLEEIRDSLGEGKILVVSGADMMDGTPVLDIKPYIAFTDSRPEASAGFLKEKDMPLLKVDFPEELLHRLPQEKRGPALEVLSQDPRPRYQEDPERVYGMIFAGMNIRFRVCQGVLTVCQVSGEEECSR